MSTVSPEAIAASAFRNWLLWKLPAACVAVNSGRAAVLRTPTPGPFVIPSGAALRFSVGDKAGLTYSVALTSGSRTSTQVAAEVNAELAGIATVDTDDRLVLTSNTAPSYDANLAHINSVVAVGADSTGTNLALGWDPGGEWSITTPVVPPGPQGVADGMPVGGLFNPSQLGKGRVLVTIGDRNSSPHHDNPRTFEWNVLLDVAIFRAEPQQVVHQTREGIQAALQAVRACLLTDAGKQLGRASSGDITYCYERKVRVSPWSFRAQDSSGKPTPGGILFDAINATFLVRVYQSP